MPQAQQEVSELNWSDVLELLQTQMRRATFETWFRGSRAEMSGDRVTIYVANAYAVEWLRERLDDVIRRAIQATTGREVETDYQVGPGPAQAAPASAPKAGPAQIPGGVSVELVSLDPTQWGIIPTARYALVFWQPLLGQPAFAAWLTLRAFAWNQAEAWPSIETLANICAGGNRHRLLGRAACVGRAEQIGALQVLQKAKIIHMRIEGRGRMRQYYFKVLDHLPLLTPRQVDYLPQGLQEAHKSWLLKCRLDYEEWEQLDFSSFVGLE